MIGADKLVDFVGSWCGDERLFATPWTPAGTAQGTFVVMAAPQDGIIIDYAERRDGELAMAGHGVVVGDGWWWFDSYGFVAEQPGEARWEDKALVLERCSARGRTIMRLALEDDTLHQEILTAVPADAELGRMLTGRYDRR